jgi:hypothetical protein
MQAIQSNDQGRQHALPQINRHLPDSYESWLRQSDAAAKKIGEERVFQIEKMSPGDTRPLVICSTSKSSAQKLIAALSQTDSADRYRVVCYVHPVLPGFDKPGMEH